MSLFDTLFGGLPRAGSETPPRPGDDTRQDMAARRQCAQQGHRYQVHGKSNPSKVVCSRCKVSWAIGARTEPAPERAS